MTSNFAFLRAEWPSLFKEAENAERHTLTEPRTCCFYARRTLELLVRWLYDADATLRRPHRRELIALLHEPTFTDLLGSTLVAKADVIRTWGNRAVHEERSINHRDALGAVRELFQVAFWMATRYTRDPANRPAPGLRFDRGLLPTRDATTPAAATRAQLRELADRLAAQDAALAEERERSAGLDAELARLRAEIAAAKAANTARPDTHDYDEEQTRDLFIDVLLHEAGWPLDQPRDREFPVTGMPTASGNGRVDYVLWDDDGTPLAVVEAKRTRRDAHDGQEQARLYADCLEKQFGQRPLIYFTNGYQHWYWDDRRYPPRPVQGFHSRDDLRLAIARRTSARSLAETEIQTSIVDRYYQHRAIRRIAETFEDKGRRKALVVMATGAGKTRTVVGLTDLLVRANWAKRVLFLADRTALVRQAVNAFRRHLPDSNPVNLVEERNGQGRVYVSTYQTMMGLIEQQRFGIGHFDLVVIDEAHRSVYQKYRAIFAYFDALLVGLTATPRDEIDHDTYGLFDLSDGMPTDAYPLEQAVADGFLVPPRAITVPLRFPREGLRYDDLSEEDKARWDELDWNDDGSVPNRVDADSVNRWLFNADTVDKVLETLMTRGVKVAGGDRLGKTIIFAQNQRHARFIVERFDVNYPHLRGTFARVITHQTENSQKLIDDFSVKERDPHIAVSVDMLDTGIDVPEVVNLVFFKTVHSRTKFWQMIGRGTRLCPDLFGPGQDKKDFLVFDCCQNFEFFNSDLPQADGHRVVPLGERLFTARVDLLAGLDGRLSGVDGLVVDPVRAEQDLRRDVADLLHGVVAGMNPDNVVVRPHRQWVTTYARRAAWDRASAQQLAEASAHLAGLPSAARDDDELAKRFDLLMLRAQLCVLNAEPGFARIAERVRGIADGLLEQRNIPAVAAQVVFLEAVAGADWWVNVTLSMLEQARRRMRGLVRLLPRSGRRVVYTDFADELGPVREVTITTGSAHVDIARFRENVRVFLHQHDNHVAVHKLRRNLPLTASDLDELERMLAESGQFDQETLTRSVRDASGLGLFIRSLVGMDRAAAVEALSGFLTDRTLCANQIEFVNMVVEHLTRNGTMTATQLYEPPFTDIAQSGPEAVFPPERLTELIGVLDTITAHASAS
ncbi:MAG TPA: DEAD/DEAH box helicase family protein [Mycobacteriales bacterium]